MPRVSILAFLALAGCGPSEGLAPIAPPSSPPPPPFTGESSTEAPEPEPSYPPLVATVDGKVIPIGAPVAATLGSKSLRIAVGSEALPCKPGSFPDYPGMTDEANRDFNLVVAPTFAGGWALTEVSFGGTHDASPKGKVDVVRIDGAKDAESIVALDFTVKSRGKLLEVKGTARAKSCGPILVDEEAKLIPQKGVKLTVGGQAITVRSATLKVEDGETTLTLGSDPLGCSGRNAGDVVATFTFEGKPLKLAGGDLDGYMPDGSSGLTVDESDLAITVGAGSPGSVVDVIFTGAGNADFAGTPATISGAVRAHYCKPF